jgi:hypothetical protein
MKKLLLSSALSAVLIAGLACSSRAITFEVFEPSANDLTAGHNTFTTFPGPATNSGDLFNALLVQPITDQHFSGDSSVSFGLTSQTGLGSGTFTSVPAAFTFDLSVPDLSANPGPNTDTFVVEGLINGTTSFNGVLGASNANFAPQTILVNGVSTPFLSGVISPAARVSLEIPGLNINGIKVDVFFDSLDALTAPGGTSPLTVGGFVRSSVTSVPEPGTLPMLLGSGVAGSLLLLRRRRA